MVDSRHRPISFEQRWLRFLDHWVSPPTAWNIAVTWRLNTTVTPPEVVAAVRRAFFLTLEENDGVLVQCPLSAREIPLDIQGLAGYLARGSI